MVALFKPADERDRGARDGLGVLVIISDGKKRRPQLGALQDVPRHGGD